MLLSYYSSDSENYLLSSSLYLFSEMDSSYLCFICSNNYFDTPSIFFIFMKLDDLRSACSYVDFNFDIRRQDFLWVRFCVEAGTFDGNYSKVEGSRNWTELLLIILLSILFIEFKSCGVLFSLDLYYSMFELWISDRILLPIVDFFLMLFFLIIVTGPKTF